MRHHLTIAAVLLLVLAAAACAGTETATGDDPDQPVTGTPDDIPTTTAPDDFGADFDAEQARQEARGVLGMNEDDLPDDVRVARRGDEQFALTEDYVLGRRTVELDDTDDSGFHVVQVTVELPEGPETFTLEPS